MGQAPKGWVDSRGKVSQVKDMLQEKLETYLERTRTAKYSNGGGGGDGGTEGGVGGGRKKRRGFGDYETARPSKTLIARVSTVTAQSIYGYSEAGPGPFLKIEVCVPYMLRALHDVLAGYHFPQGDAAGRWNEGVVVDVEGLTGRPFLRPGRSQTFNSSIDAVQQFMVDSGLVGCQWVRVAPAYFRSSANGGGEEENEAGEEAEGSGERRTTCLREWRVPLSQLEFIDVDAMPAVAPLRILSFDIEAAGRRGVFPQASDDPVIQIALHFHVVGAPLSLLFRK